MTKIEQLEAFQKSLQSRIARNSNVIADFDIAANTTIAKEQAVFKKLIGFVIEEKRKILKYEKDLEAYRKNLERMEGEDG